MINKLIDTEKVEKAGHALLDWMQAYEPTLNPFESTVVARSCACALEEALKEVINEKVDKALKEMGDSDEE